MVRGRFLRDGITYGQDIVFLGHFDLSDHVFNDGLVLEALHHTLDSLEITKAPPNGLFLQESTVKGIITHFL